ncbi:MAG: hypothetical protein E6Q34_03820, partial [Burkholderiaceae bacterium]
MMNQLSAMLGMFYEPSASFRDLKDRPASWLPLALTLILSLGVFYWFYVTVDFAWLVDRMMSAQPDMKPEQREAMQNFMKRDTMMYSTLIGVLIVTPIIYALHAIYLLIASRVIDGGLNFMN